MRITKLLAVLALSLCSTAHAVDPLWTVDLGDKVEWSQVTTAGTLLVNTGKQVIHVDPDNGEVLWQKATDKKLTPYNFHDLDGSGFLLVAEQFQNIPPKTRLSMYDLISGDVIWESDELYASNLAVVPDVERGQVLFIGGFPGHARDKTSGNLLRAYDMASGEMRFETTLSKFNRMPMHLTDTSGMFSVATDLSGHARPVIDGNVIYLPYTGITALNLDSGDILWQQEFDTVDPGLKKTHSPIVIDGDTIYKTGRGLVVAIDRQTGKIRWESKQRKKEMMPELQVHGEHVIVRIGGMFSNGKDMIPAKPFGVLALDRGTGEERWSWTKAKDSITNMAVLPDVGQIVIADTRNLYRLDLAASGRPDVIEKRNLEFKRKFGGADAAVAGGKIASGLLSGGLVGGLQGGIGAAMGGGRDRGDPPSSITAFGNDLVVAGNYHVLSYNAEKDEDNWSIAFDPPGVNPMMLAFSGAAMAFTATANAGMHSSMSVRNQKLDNALTSADRLGSIMTRRFASAGKSGTMSFFLTKASREMEGARLQLMGIDLASGESVGAVPIEEKEPVFTVDNVGERVYYFHKEREVRAYAF